MQINWRVRLKNKTFWVSLAALILPFAYNLLGLCGIVPSLTQDTLSDLVLGALNILVAIGLIIDPTTQGLSDSDRVLHKEDNNNG